MDIYRYNAIIHLGKSNGFSAEKHASESGLASFRAMRPYAHCCASHVVRLPFFARNGSSKIMTMQLDILICMQCGNPVRITARFCGQCGAALEVSPDAATALAL